MSKKVPWKFKKVAWMFKLVPRVFKDKVDNKIKFTWQL